MKKRIVIVDDYENTLMLTAFTLKTLGYELCTAKNGKDALQYFNGQPVNLLITDYNMPIMNGCDLVRAVRNIPEYIDMPIIMFSTAKNKDIIETIETYKVNDWITKPIKSIELITVVKKHLNEP